MRASLRMRAPIWLAVALSALLLQACDREPVRTVVPPHGSSEAALSSPPRAAASAARKPRATVSAPRAEAPAGDGAGLLAQRDLIVPVEGIAPSSLVDTYEQSRGSRPHEALDILAPRGTRVLAVDDGTLVKLFTSKPGGLTVYQFDPSGRLAYYYAHLDRYSDGLREGMPLHRGDLIGYVGSTGNASPEAPHLHFAVFVLGPEKQWWKGEAINPYAALRQAQAVVAQR